MSPARDTRLGAAPDAAQDTAPDLHLWAWALRSLLERAEDTLGLEAHLPSCARRCLCRGHDIQAGAHDTALLVDTVRRHFDVLPQTEWRAECDPGRASPARMQALCRLGFRQVRLRLAELGPLRSVQLDLVCGLPLQNAARGRGTLPRVLPLAPDRIGGLPCRHRPQRFWKRAGDVLRVTPVGRLRLDELCNLLDGADAPPVAPASPRWAH
jgi:hypothetical protein